jgi:hypothetical protein
MNKDLKIKEYIETLKDMKLSSSSRSRMQDSLQEYARFHAVRVVGDSRSIEQVPQRTSLFTQFKQSKSMTAAIIAIALIVGGGTSYAAEGAVPGDFLYTVKTEVNENVKSAFAVSNEAEAKLQARLIEERLKEAEELAVEGKLTAQASADISSRLQNHYTQAQERSAQAEANGDYESSATVRASMEGSFRTHADVLTDLNARISGNSGSSLIADIQAYADATAQAQAQATTTIEASVNVQGTTEATVERAENFITEVKAKLDRARADISADAYARAEAKLNEAVSIQTEAQASLQTEAFKVAYVSAQTAIRIASEVESMLNSMLRLQVDFDLDTDEVIDGVLDVRVNSDSETDTQSETETTNESDSFIDVELDAATDTNVIDAGVQTDTSVRSGINL